MTIDQGLWAQKAPLQHEDTHSDTSYWCGDRSPAHQEVPPPPPRPDVPAPGRAIPATQVTPHLQPPLLGHFLFLFLKNLFIYLFLAELGLRCCVRAFSSCGDRGLLFVVVHGLQSAGLVVVAHGLSCSVACGIFPDQGSNPCPLHSQADSQPLCHQGSPQFYIR